MKCPHCLVEIFSNPKNHHLGKDIDGEWFAEVILCPSCHRFIISLGMGELNMKSPVVSFSKWSKFPVLIRPKGGARPPCPIEVPKTLCSDYEEACLVLYDSPKASAALSRRCLQHLLRDFAHVKPSNLADEIQELIDRKNLPSQIIDAIDAVRNIGNFAAHPNKSKSTGQIVDVEPHEAEWNLDVLESLFDYYFVQPAKLQTRKDALNKKLKDTGKGPMK